MSDVPQKPRKPFLKAPGSYQSLAPQYLWYRPSEGPPPQTRTTATIMKIIVADSLSREAQNSSSAYPRVPKMLMMMIKTRKTCKGLVSTSIIQDRARVGLARMTYTNPDGDASIRCPVLDDSAADCQFQW